MNLIKKIRSMLTGEREETQDPEERTAKREEADRAIEAMSRRR